MTSHQHDGARSGEMASIDQRVGAVEQLMHDRNLIPTGFFESFKETVEEEWVPQNGARMVAKAWVDPAYRERLLANGKAAAEELGFSMPSQHKHLVVLENTDQVHNVIVCTLCSCTAFTIIGMPPGWYKDFEYRARVVRQARTVLAEMGLTLAPEVEIRVWDTTTDTRYMVLPSRPSGTEGLSEAELAALVTKESMIGVEHLAAPVAQEGV